jgi:hypothetical protein
MTTQSLIFGSIDGISEKDYLRLKPTLSQRFDAAGWKDGSLVINSMRDHGKLKDVFSQIADRIGEDGFGSLLYVGQGSVVCFYFGCRRYVGRRYREPLPPEWWPADRS